MELARKCIRESKPYIAGKPIEETKRELGLREVIKLASNENPLGASPRALKAIRQAAGKVNLYPDSNGFYIKQAIARANGLSPANVVLGNGSDELIDIIIKTFLEPDENIVTSDTTFVEYEIICGTYGRAVKKAALKDFRYDLRALRDLVDAKTKLVFIANPNNPTGTYVNAKDMDSFISSLPENVITVIDEAYDTFIDVDDYPSGKSYLGKRNVLVLKTFSKAYGLAGLRIGYCLGDVSLTANMEKARQPFNVNLLAQKAALAALGDKAFLKKTREVTLAGKKYLCREFDALGLRYIPSATNFILVDVKKDCGGVFRDLLRLGVIVRDMKQYKLDSFIRVTIGKPAENRKFIAALKKVLS
ncbi:MAG: histidinol-phosphate transaminase [Deltaproteobacteria bacterium]